MTSWREPNILNPVLEGLCGEEVRSFLRVVVVRLSLDCTVLECLSGGLERKAPTFVQLLGKDGFVAPTHYDSQPLELPA
jgi:hypothetical protein